MFSGELLTVTSFSLAERNLTMNTDCSREIRKADAGSVKVK